MMQEYVNYRMSYEILDWEFPFAVDIPIPLRGLGDKLPLIMDAAATCSDPAQVWSHSVSADTTSAGEVRIWLSRIGVKTSQDARRIARTFRALGARRVR